MGDDKDNKDKSMRTAIRKFECSEGYHATFAIRLLTGSHHISGFMSESVSKHAYTRGSRGLGRGGDVIRILSYQSFARAAVSSSGKFPLRS